MISTTTVPPKDIIAIVAADFGITPEQLTGRRRHRTWTHARFIAAYLIKVFDPGISLPALARALGKDAHSGASHWLDRAAELMNDPDIEARVEAMQRTITGVEPNRCPLCQRQNKSALAAAIERIAARLYPGETPTNPQNLSTPGGIHV